jgi:Planctomycete cytochrome C
MQRRVLGLLAAALLFGASAQAADEKIDFVKQIQPILVESCGKCHGAEKAQGKMRLHTAAALKEKWDADKELIVAGEPEKSELYARLVLPADDKKRMPKGGDPLAKEKIELIAKWIKEGAVLPTAAAVPAADPGAKPEATEAPKKAEKPAELPLPKVDPAPKEAIDKLTAAGAQVMPLFADSPLLTVSFAHRSEPAGDAEVALLAGVAEQCYGLNLADSKPTDAGLAPLAGLKNLAELHLERSSVTDAGLVHIKGLGSLQYLNLFGTGITDAGLEHLKGLKHLQKLYLWQTKVNYEPAMALEKDTPGLMVNLGFNHPVVMKMRLTKELEAAKKQAEEAKADETKAQQQLEAAKKNAESVNARVADVEKQLKEASMTPEEKAAAEKAAADKVAADKAAAEKMAAEKAAAEKAKAEADAKAAADMAAADKAAADKAAAEKAEAKK